MKLNLYGNNLVAPLLSRTTDMFFFVFIVGISVLMLATPYYPYAIVPGFFIITLLLLGSFPKLGYYIIILAVPFSEFTGISDLSVSKLAGFWVFLYVVYLFIVKKKKLIDIKSNLWVWLIFFFFIAFISSLSSSYRITSFDNLRKLLTAYLIFFVTISLLNKDDFCSTFPKVVIWSIGISAFLTIIDFFFHLSLFSDYGSAKRAEGAAGDPNILCSIVLFGLPFLPHFFFSSRKLLVKLIIIAVFVLFLTTIIISYSRSGALITAIVLLLILLGQAKKIKVKYFGFLPPLLTLVVLCCVIFMPGSYMERMQTLVCGSKEGKADTSIGRRKSYLAVGIQAMKDNPIIGSGPGTFRELFRTTPYAAHYAGGDLEKYRRAAHNSYLEIAVGTGILGFLVFVTGMLFALKNFSYAIKRFQLNEKKEMQSLVSAYRLSFVSLVMYYAILPTLYNKYLFASFAFSHIAIKVSENIKTSDNENYKIQAGKDKLISV